MPLAVVVVELVAPPMPLAVVVVVEPLPPAPFVSPVLDELALVMPPCPPFPMLMGSLFAQPYAARNKGMQEMASRPRVRS